MKWFKHDSNALKDEKIQFLMNKHGSQAYTIYFGLCELCAEKIDKKLIPSIQIDWHFAEQLLHSKRSTIRKVMVSCAEANLLVTESNDKLLICSIPNLLKRLDNWTNNSQVTYKQLASKEVEQEGEVEKEVKSKEGGRFAPPTQDEVTLYFINDLKGSKEQAVRFFQFYDSKDWFVGKNKMRRWHSAAARSLEWGGGVAAGLKVYGKTKDGQQITDPDIARVMGFLK